MSSGIKALFNQLFYLLIASVHSDWNNLVQNLINDVIQFLTCDAFKESYMQALEDNIGLLACIRRDQTGIWTPFDGMTEIVTKDKSLNTFLCDEDIREEMIHLYGSIPDVSIMAENEKCFFFDNGDISQFGKSPYDTGTK